MSNVFSILLRRLGGSPSEQFRQFTFVHPQMNHRGEGIWKYLFLDVAILGCAQNLLSAAVSLYLIYLAVGV